MIGFSCSQTEEENINQDLNEQINMFHKKRSDVVITPVDMNQFAIDQRQFDVSWLYERVGKKVSFYPSKVTAGSFSKNELYKLIKRAYVPHDEEFRFVHKNAAIHALRNSIYRQLSQNIYDEAYLDMRDIIYTPALLKIMIAATPSVLGDIPPNLSNYYQILYDALRQNVTAFEYLTMQFKTDPKVLEFLFYTSNSSYIHPNQKIAIKYATYEEAMKFLSRNGLLLEYVSSNFQDNSELVYAAILQNELAGRYASPRLRRIIETSGPEKLIGFSARLYLWKDGISQKSSDIWYVFSTTISEYIDRAGFFATSSVSKVRSYLFNEELEADFVDDIAESDKLEETRSLLPFTEDNSIMTDPRLIIQIQNLHGRPLRYLWRIAKIDRQREIYIAYYQPQGRRYLASIVYRDGNNFILSDYKATLTQDGSTIWRYNDHGRFDPTKIQVIDIEEIKTKELRVQIKWRGAERSSIFLLIEKNGKFVKQFLSHKDELR